MKAGHIARAAVAAASLASLPASAADTPTCAREAGPSHGVLRVLDGETLLLEGGREVRLVGALAPRPDLLSGSERDWPPAQAAARALAALVAQRTIALRYDGRRRDRYGRALAQVYVDTPAGRTWVQEHLIREGHARAYGLPGNTACLKELLAAEQAARAAGHGLWRLDGYRVRAATDVESLSRLVGRFTLVEGRVAEVTRTQKLTYVNFGADWRRDFTASLANAIVDRSDDGADRLRGLANKTVRVRGWIERRNGPMVVLSSPDEIEVLDEGGESAQR